MENQQLDGFRDRLQAVEELLDLNKRLENIEGNIGRSSTPWWKSGKVITILASVLAGIVPAVNVINNCFVNYRESRRLLIEQQEKIRQTYLDRVLRPGANEAEQQRVFSLLSRLSTDPELQGWAKDELNKINVSIEDLRKKKEADEKNLLDAERRLSETNARMSRAINAEHSQRVSAELDAATAKKELEQGVASMKKEISEINQRLGVSPPKTTECTFRVISEPPGATVQVFAGGIIQSVMKVTTTPADVVLPIDGYTLKFSKQGYREVEKGVNLRTGCLSEVRVVLSLN